MIPPSIKLTEKQKDVFGLFCQGKMQKEIALALNMSQSSVATHIARIRMKFGVKTNRELMAMTVGTHNVGADVAILRADLAGLEMWRKTLLREIALATTQRDEYRRLYEELLERFRGSKQCA